MSIFALEIIAHDANVPIQDVVVAITDAANRHARSSDQIADAMSRCDFKKPDWREALKTCVESFDCGMSEEMVIMMLFKKMNS